MTEIKTKPTDMDVHEFIRRFASTEQKIADSFALLKLMEETTGFKPVMWGPSIIGFGSYHYKSERSRQEGDWPLVGFSPRKSAISLYVYAGIPAQDEMLKELGKYKMGKACIYVSKLSDIHLETLIRLIQSTVEYMRKKYP